MKYSLDPCTACFNKFEKEGANVNDINNCCYEIATAFKGTYSVNSLRGTDSMKSCIQCVGEKLKMMGPFPGGDTYCTKDINPPPVFAQVPHYLPKILETSNNLEDATNTCISMCKNLGTPYPHSCIDNCITDAAAVIPDYTPVIEEKVEVITEKIPINDVKFKIIIGAKFNKPEVLLLNKHSY